MDRKHEGDAISCDIVAAHSWQELLEALLGLLGAAVGEDWPEIPERELWYLYSSGAETYII